MRPVAAALLTTVVPMLVGQRWFGGHVLVRWSLGAALGIVFLAIGTMMGGFVGLPLAGGGAALLAAWLLGRRMRWTPPAPMIDPSVRRLLVVLLCVGAVLLVLSTMRPVAGYDGWFVWSVKSKSLAAEQSFFTPVFLSDTYSYSSQEYPPLLPSWQAAAYLVSGDLTVSWPLQFQQAWLWLVAGIALVSLLAAVSRLAIFLPLAWLVSPQLLWETMQGYADVTMSLLLVLGTIVLWSAGGDRRAHVVGGFLLGGAALTKAEGLPLVVIVLVCLLLRAGYGRRALLAPATAGGILLPWFVWMQVHNLGSHMITDRSFTYEVLSQVPERIPLIYGLMVPEAITPVRWGLLLPACVAAILVARRLNWRLAAATVLSVLLFTVVYALWPYRSYALDIHITTNVDRVLIASLGLLALAASLPGSRRAVRDIAAPGGRPPLTPAEEAEASLPSAGTFTRMRARAASVSPRRSIHRPGRGS